MKNLIYTHSLEFTFNFFNSNNFLSKLPQFWRIRSR